MDKNDNNKSSQYKTDNGMNNNHHEEDYNEDDDDDNHIYRTSMLPAALDVSFYIRQCVHETKNGWINNILQPRNIMGEIKNKFY